MTRNQTPTMNWDFVKPLTQPPLRLLGVDVSGEPSDNTVDLRQGLKLVTRFADPHQLLTTATNDLQRFLQDHQLLNDAGLPIIVQAGDDFKHESFELALEQDEIRLTAKDVQGARRGLYYLISLLQGADGRVLKRQVVKREAWLQHRISRCYYGPIKRPPFNRDELADEVNYYPDGYLSRLAEQGINGLWLTIEFKDLCATSFTTPSPLMEQRLAKLRRTVEQCRRYGVNVWAFCIEPEGFDADAPILKVHPELAGAINGNQRCFCPSTLKAQRYLYEATNWLFSNVPHLAGMINISHGEGTTTCLSSASPMSDERAHCPRCGQLPNWKILHQSLTAMSNGMKAASPDAQLISWLYMPSVGQRADWLFELAQHTPKDVVLQYNFESNMTVTQLGQLRVAGDYWQSAVGPSEDFRRLAQDARQAGTPMSAKLQVGASHEIATVPYVPVPGILYRKHKRMREQGCTHAMHCWYFGCFPGLMNHAAGELTFHDFAQDESSFLHHLAGRDWREYAPTIVKAWKMFEDAYTQYPFDNMFQYYGPMHDGPTWPLHLEPVLTPLAPTWKVDFPRSGDTIGECLGRFTLLEALALCDQMADTWQQGLDLLEPLRVHFTNDQQRLDDLSVMDATGLLLDTGRNILRFYHLRQQLYTDRDVLEPMRVLVKREIQNSQRLMALCEANAFLGFHPEAESHKFDARSLCERINQLHQLLEENGPFANTRRLLDAGQSLRVNWSGRPRHVMGSNWVDSGPFKWRCSFKNDQLRIEFDADVSTNDAGVMWVYLLDEFGIESPRRINCDPAIPRPNNQWAMLTILENSSDRQRMVIHLPLLAWGDDPSRQPRHISLAWHAIGGTAAGTERTTWPASDQRLRARNALGAFDPRFMAYLANEPE